MGSIPTDCRRTDFAFWTWDLYSHRIYWVFTARFSASRMKNMPEADTWNSGFPKVAFFPRRYIRQYLAHLPDCILAGAWKKRVCWKPELRQTVNLKKLSGLPDRPESQADGSGLPELQQSMCSLNDTGRLSPVYRIPPGCNRLCMACSKSLYRPSGCLKYYLREKNIEIPLDKYCRTAV